MKFNKFVGTAGLGALSVALLSTSALAQSTAISIPKSVTNYYTGDDTEDSCVELRGSLEDAADLTYLQFLNKAYCTAKLEALAKEAAIEEEGLQQAVTNAEGDLRNATTERNRETGIYTAADTAKKNGDEKLAGLEADVVKAQAAAEANAAALADAYQQVAADFFASDSTEASVEDYIAANPDDENVVAYLAAKNDFNDGRTAVTTAQSAVTTFKDGEYDDLVRALANAEETLYGVGGTADDPTDDSILGVYNAAVTTYEEAVKALEKANSDLDSLNKAADNALASNVAGTRNDDILASAANPAKGVLETSDCLASGAEDCDNDVGQAIVDGLDSLHQADQTEQAARIAADTNLQKNITAEADTRAAADLVLQANINKEVSDRKAADVVLQANIDKEVTDRKAADVVLQANIDKEVTDRKAADTTLQNNINAEIAARTAADVTLQNNINTVNTRVTQLGERVDSLTKESRQGIAMAMALAAIPTVNYGKFSLGLGVGTFASETAAALGMDFVVSERVKFKLGVTTTGDETGGSAGIAIGF